MAQNETTLVRLKPSRKPLKEGDLFRMKLPSGQFLFGRVIVADIEDRDGFLTLPGSNLIYIYAFLSDSDTVEWDQLSRNELLIPPLFTNRKGWLYGLFETFMSRPLTRRDRLKKHCFHVKGKGRGSYIDERGNPVWRRVEPCGFFGQASYLYVDELISRALGLLSDP